ncbi:hypothetical protein HETIRDRAFT_309762 [Heterobasidion irregulare TC 32-1]|uniref:Translation initiation factor eIF2B subunit epsilon n=1 Tax=Heterobasidion irregulare (strain TC 32-1) TaxID=747525 RepID=W4KIU9_HETIT|nr:uncharacterized protein HETIRDRAFT_309762 [Heterobasidion irregulare TC 32-1]ETW85768.1 hypothetical protein HETIRDRAFT_309762 [Heterobasidion irregulare TC 32-1]
MPPKASLGKEKLVDEDDEVLQAVILADSFNKRFKPMTASRPRCLLPICNAPLLDWTLESLALAGVQEAFVICRSYADQVKAAIRESKWSHPASSLKIVPIVTAKETFSPGDAMRDIYTHGIITGDFILVAGDLVSNVRIDEVVRAHKERRRTNKDAIMTMVVKESGARHRTRSRGDSAVFVLNKDTSECVHYEPVSGYPPKSITRIPREIFESHRNIEIRNDFIDCFIDVCSVDVPSLFQDNFDYADVRRDFVHGVLTSDLLMKNIYCYVVKEGYAARVQDTKSYDAISKDILSRWAFPLVPDDNHPSGHVYEHLRGNKYIPGDNSVILSRTSKVGNNTLIGPSTRISAGAQVLASTLGAHCSIGVNSVVRNSYLFEGVVVGTNCLIENSIIGAGVEIGDSSRVARGALIADGVKLGANTKLLPFERVSKRKQSEIDGHAEGDDEGEGDSDEDSEWEEAEKGDNYSDLELSDPGSVTSTDESDSDSDDSFNEHVSPSSSTTSLPTSAAAAAVSAGAHAADTEFQNEVRLSLERAFSEGHSLDNASVELKTLRMASNVPLRRVREAVVAGIVDNIELVENAAEQRMAIKRCVDRWGELINRIGGADGVETVTILQAHCAASTRMPLFGQILAALYQNDIIEEDDVRGWHAQPDSKGEGLKAGEVLENFKRCWLVGARMIHQFDQQESSSEGEDESDGSGSGDDAGSSDSEGSGNNEVSGEGEVEGDDGEDGDEGDEESEDEDEE